MPRTLLLVAAIVALPAFQDSAPVSKASAPAQGEPTAREVLDRMERAYSRCSTYQDAGTVQFSISLPEPVRLEASFKTAFIRPKRFRFEFTQTESNGAVTHHIAWRNGSEIRRWMDADSTVATPPMLSLLLAELVSSTHGTATTVPAMLMKDEAVGPSLVAQMANAKRIEDVTIDGTPCFCISSVTPAHHGLPETAGGSAVESGQFVTTLAIAKASSLLRQIQQTITLPSLRSDVTATYTPTTDAEIPDAQLEFRRAGSRK
jgi:hypothetical protein